MVRSLPEAARLARSANPTRGKAIHDTRNPQPDTRVSLKFIPGGGEGIGSLRSGQSPVAVSNAHLRKASALLRRPPPGVLIPSAGFYDYTLYSKLYTLVR